MVIEHLAAGDLRVDEGVFRGDAQAAGLRDGQRAHRLRAQRCCLQRDHRAV